MKRKSLSSRLVDLMQQAGLSQPTATLYEFILSREFTSEDILEQQFRSQDIRQDIERLLELRVIAVDIVRDKYALYPINPDLAWGSVSNDMTWRFYNSVNDYEKPRSHYALPSRYREPVQHARNVINAIREIATRLYESAPSVERHRWREALDKEHLAVLLSEAILQGSSRICCVSKPPRSSQLAIIWESIVQRMKEGTAYQRIANLTEVIEHGLYIIQRDIEDYGVDLRVLDLDDIKHKFYVVDNNFLVVYHLTGTDRSQQVGRVTREKNTIKRYRKRFSKYYEKATPGLFVVQQLRKASKQLLETAQRQGFNEAEIAWLQCLINWGIFCNIEIPSISDLQELEEKALGVGIVKQGTTGKLVPKYCVTMRDIEREWLNN